MTGSEQLLGLLDGQPVLPVVTIRELQHAVPLARALVAGGLKGIEITLRSEVALDAIRIIAQEVPDALPGAGTILSTRQYEQAVQAGARFIVSPGHTERLLEAARMSETPFLPGCTTPSEIMAAQEQGFSFVKFFPAEAAGGTAFLSALAAPFPQMRFCPTGGIHSGNVASYLSLANVACVGGSWLTPDHLVRQADWKAIAGLARQSAS